MGYYRKQKKLRKEYGYDPDPPSCRNCRHKTSRKTSTGESTVRWCGFFDFSLPSAHGICDGWQGGDGAVLDGQRENQISTLVAHLVTDFRRHK